MGRPCDGHQWNDRGFEAHHLIKLILHTAFLDLVVCYTNWCTYSIDEALIDRLLEGSRFSRRSIKVVDFDVFLFVVHLWDRLLHYGDPFLDVEVNYYDPSESRIDDFYVIWATKRAIHSTVHRYYVDLWDEEKWHVRLEPMLVQMLFTYQFCLLLSLLVPVYPRASVFSSSRVTEGLIVHRLFHVIVFYTK